VRCVSRYVSGNAQTQWRASAGYTEVEGLLANCYMVAELALGLAQQCNNKKKPPTLPKECDDKSRRVNCEECLNALYHACLKQLDTLNCYHRLRVCQFLCIHGERPDIGRAVYNCFTYKWS